MRILFRFFKRAHHLLKKKLPIYKNLFTFSVDFLKFTKNHGLKGSKIFLSRKIIDGNFIRVKYQDKKINFSTEYPETIQSAKIYFISEPEVSKWISEFKPNSIFFDIGGNLGGMSLLAASYGHNSFCFEPAAVNLNSIQKNISLNPPISDKITVIPLAIDKISRKSFFFMQSLHAGTARNSFGQEKWWGDGYKTIFKQPTLSMSLDDCIKVFSLPIPRYLKIDVDGNDSLVLEGSKKLLGNKELEEIIIELPLKSDTTSNVINNLENKYGFKVKRKTNNEILKIKESDKVLKKYITNYYFRRF